MPSQKRYLVKFRMFSPSFLVACILVVLIILRELGSLSMYIAVSGHSAGHSAAHSAAHSTSHSSGNSSPPTQHVYSGASGAPAPMPKNGLPGWAIALICIGVFVVLCILMLLVTRKPVQVVPVQ